MQFSLEEFLLLPPKDRNRLLLEHMLVADIYKHLGENMAATLRWYESNYDTCFSYWDKKDGRKEYIESQNEKVCRFCGMSPPDVSFKKNAHAISNFLGNNTLFSHEECDVCNEIFSKIEDSFSKYIGLGRTLSGIRGKNKIPSYKSFSKLSRIDRNHKGFKIFDNVTDSITAVDTETQTLSIKEDVQPYVPIYIYKTLVKIALSVMDKESLSRCKDAVEWVKNLTDNRFLGLGHLKAIQAFCPGDNPFKTVAIFLLKRRENPGEPVPAFMLVLVTANYFFQIVIPGCLDDHILDKLTITFSPFPLPWAKEVTDKVKYYIVDFSSPEIVSSFQRTHTLHFDRFEINQQKK
jgi:hypothetical protein